MIDGYVASYDAWNECHPDNPEYSSKNIFMIDKTKEEILNGYDIIIYKDSPDTSDVAYSNDDTKSAMQTYADQEKRKNAIAVLQFISSDKSPYGVMFGDQPERFASEEREFTSEEIYDLYLQSLPLHT